MRSCKQRPRGLPMLSQDRQENVGDARRKPHACRAAAESSRSLAQGVSGAHLPYERVIVPGVHSDGLLPSVKKTVNKSPMKSTFWPIHCDTGFGKAMGNQVFTKPTVSAECSVISGKLSAALYFWRRTTQFAKSQMEGWIRLKTKLIMSR
jgi:hypothetical protein